MAVEDVFGQEWEWDFPGLATVIRAAYGGATGLNERSDDVASVWRKTETSLIFGTRDYCRTRRITKHL